MARFSAWKVWMVSLAAIVCISVPIARAAETNPDEVAAIKGVIEAAYIRGVHIDRDAEAFRKGFHPAFIMFMYENGKLSTMSADEWAKRIEEGKKKTADSPQAKTTWDIPLVEVSGDAAVARVEIHRDGKHVFTDFISLYKMSEGWMIIGKIYYRHP